GVPRNRIGALDAATAAATSWSPDANGSVRALAAGAPALYVGGQFTSIGGLARGRIAAVDWATGAVDPLWDPGANSIVLAPALDPAANVLYVGGQFTQIDLQVRSRIAALDAATGTATPWDPSANGQVFTLLATGGTVFAGGSFTQVAGQPRGRNAPLRGGTPAGPRMEPPAAKDHPRPPRARPPLPRGAA